MENVTTPPRVLTVVGARPQFVKAAVVSREFTEQGLGEILVHTGQHYDDDMSAVFFDQLGLPRPDHMLDIGPGGHGVQTGRMLIRLEELMEAERPAAVLVYGDTNSTLAGGLAAAKLGIPVAHVEAGLRSFQRAMPEEINRVVTDHLSARLYAPTRTAIDNLRREGIAGSHVVSCGDVMFDAVRQFAPLALRDTDRITALGVTPGDFVLATMHRAATVDDPAALRSVFDGLAEVAKAIPVLLPLHPRTRARAQACGILDSLPRRFIVTGPVGYLTMLALEKAARLIATDSGGVQKEAYFAGTPCVTLRAETEWTELVEAGWNRLCPPDDAAAIAATILAELDAKRERGIVADYGDGFAARAIVADLAAHLLGAE